MTDKGNNGASFQRDGATPGDAIVEWNRRVTQLTRATKAVVKQTYGKAPKRTYLFGISNGGYLTRWQLENRPRLYDGGVDWEGTLFRAAGPNLFTYLPTALREYPKYKAGSEDAHQKMLAAGFAPGSEFTWDYHYAVYWDLTQRLYREEFDPTYDGALDAGIPFCLSGTPTCDADYDYSTRPTAQAAMRKVELTGDLRRPLLTLHGTLDALLPISTDSDVYRTLIKREHQAREAPLLPDRRRHPRGRPQRGVRRPGPPAPALRPHRLHRDDRLGRAPPGPAPQPHDPAPGRGDRHHQHLRPAIGATEAPAGRGASEASDSKPGAATADPHPSDQGPSPGTGERARKVPCRSGLQPPAG